LPGALAALNQPPLLDPGVIAGEQDLGHGIAFKLSGAGVHRFFEKTIPKRLDNSWQQAGYPFDDRRRRDFAPSKDEVPQRCLLFDVVVSDTLVHTLISSAYQG
jgi:hypothetical protein